ncbi:DUF4282 domain-containing protein [Kaistia dalseonensis]|uniref:DUF4282 domain-containing protein n=1 Tax=Kaistia dalseonensis TaxID=410840 RepID=A0ABU0H640_9HYPH|nr:DUF4282 domain-containing protein [Kaistia dalseonensis]MCX5495196.1 DUF4282 domain-containing protein [Kaistia dalseonensis]MDQ0437781.1 hypothetical protein [Kaistia dalseonensis]
MISFFDVFRWDRFVATSVIELLFWLLAAMSVLLGGYGLFAGLQFLSSSPIGGLLAIALSIIGGVTGIVGARVLCEAVVIMFRMNDNLLDIRENTLAVAETPTPAAAPQAAVAEDPELAMLERKLAESRAQAARRLETRAVEHRAHEPVIEPKAIEVRVPEPRVEARVEPRPEPRVSESRPARSWEVRAPEPRRTEPRAWDAQPGENRPQEGRTYEPRSPEHRSSETRAVEARLSEHRLHEPKAIPSASESRQTEQRAIEGRLAERRAPEIAVPEVRAPLLKAADPHLVERLAERHANLYAPDPRPSSRTPARVDAEPELPKAALLDIAPVPLAIEPGGERDEATSKNDPATHAEPSLDVARALEDVVEQVKTAVSRAVDEELAREAAGAAVSSAVAEAVSPAKADPKPADPKLADQGSDPRPTPPKGGRSRSSKAQKAAQRQAKTGDAA